MALSINITVTCNFENLFDISKYANILTEDQKQEINTAITKSYTINGIYAKIGELSGDKDTMNLRLDLYTNSTKETFLESRNYAFVPDLTSSRNFILQGYEYLKINEYPSAIDLLDEGQTI